MSNFCASPVHSAFLVPQTAARPAVTCITDRVKTEIMYFRKRSKVVPVLKNCALNSENLYILFGPNLENTAAHSTCHIFMSSTICFIERFYCRVTMSSAFAFPPNDN